MLGLFKPKIHTRRFDLQSPKLAESVFQTLSAALDPTKVEIEIEGTVVVFRAKDADTLAFVVPEAIRSFEIK